MPLGMPTAAHSPDSPPNSHQSHNAPVRADDRRKCPWADHIGPFFRFEYTFRKRDSPPILAVRAAAHGGPFLRFTAQFPSIAQRPRRGRRPKEVPLGGPHRPALRSTGRGNKPGNGPLWAAARTAGMGDLSFDGKQARIGLTGRCGHRPLHERFRGYRKQSLFLVGAGPKPARFLLHSIMAANLMTLRNRAAICSAVT